MSNPFNLGHLRSMLADAGNGAHLHVLVDNVESRITDVTKTVVSGAEHVTVHTTHDAATPAPVPVAAEAPPAPEPVPAPAPDVVPPATAAQ